MIKSYRNKGLQVFAETGNTRKLPNQQFAERTAKLLTAMKAATVNSDMDKPGFNFHFNKQFGRFSVRVTGNWRITWAWDQGFVDVDIEDYH